MKAAFDDSAAGYDADFTNTKIGRLQRQSVWDYLIDSYGNSFPQDVLELNCGTGEDAVFFAKHGSKVLATDVSERMLDITRQKLTLANVAGNVTAIKLDINNISNTTFDQKFNLVFSNFGGLNCIDETSFKNLVIKTAACLQPGGRMILVMMPRFCAWESVYFLSHLQFANAFRRRKKKAQTANIGSSSVDTWYYDPKQVGSWASEYYSIKHVQPVGITVPPSYFKKTFINNNTILKNLEAAEKKLNKFKSLSRMADHFLIDLQLK